MEKMKAYLDEIDTPMGQIDFATDEEGAFLGLRFRESRNPQTLEEELEHAGFDLVPVTTVHSCVLLAHASSSSNTLRASVALSTCRWHAKARTSKKRSGRNSRASRSARRAPTAKWPRRSD